MNGVVIAFSDEPLLLAGLHLVDSEASGIVFHIFSDRGTLVQQIRDIQPDVLLLDRPPEMDLRIVKQIQAAAPKCRIVLWLRSIPTEMAWQAVDMGVRGILRKTATGAELLECVRNVRSGEVWLERSLAAALLTLKSIRLTRRESQMVMLLAHGMKNKEIAGELGIGERTVKVYISRLFEKVGAKDRLELALYGLRNMPAISDTAGRDVAVHAMRPIALRQSL